MQHSPPICQDHFFAAVELLALAFTATWPATLRHFYNVKYSFFSFCHRTTATTTETSFPAVHHCRNEICSSFALFIFQNISGAETLNLAHVYSWPSSSCFIYRNWTGNVLEEDLNAMLESLQSPQFSYIFLMSKMAQCLKPLKQLANVTPD